MPPVIRDSSAVANSLRPSDRRISVTKFWNGLEEPGSTTTRMGGLRVGSGAAATPWADWMGPLAYWLIFVFACYGLFYFLAYVVLNYWSEREKLIFPLAQLPEMLLPESDNENRWWPRVFCHPLFWSGVVLASGVLSWNACVGAGWIAGLQRIPFGMSSSDLQVLVEGTSLEGLRYFSYPAMQFHFGFVAGESSVTAIK